MKKNYFILQMLVLLALLVPRTAWGQYDPNERMTTTKAQKVLENFWENPQNEKQVFNIDITEGQSVSQDIQLIGQYSEYSFFSDLTQKSGDCLILE